MTRSQNGLIFNVAIETGHTAALLTTSNYSSLVGGCSKAEIDKQSLLINIASQFSDVSALFKVLEP